MEYAFITGGGSIQSGHLVSSSSPIGSGLFHRDLKFKRSSLVVLRKNLDLLITKYGIDYAKGQAITAKLFPNPIFSLSGSAAFTQRQTFEGTRSITPQIQQMFLLAGKRGYRIESAEYGIKSAEAAFSDAIRELTLTLKDTYFQVQLATRRLELAKENQERFRRILTIGELRFKKALLLKLT